MPFYDHYHRVFYLNREKKLDAAVLAFCQGPHLDDPGGLLQATDRKVVRHLYFKQIEEVHTDAVAAMVQQALTVNEMMYKKR